MDLQSQLIECCKQKGQSRWKCSLASLAIHLGIIAFIVVMGMQATHKVDAEEKTMPAFLASGPAPPPPPPPPPPAASSAPKSTPTPTLKPTPVQTSFVQPHVIPKELPKVDPLPTSMASSAQTAPADTQPAGEPGGVAGGVAGGVPGGVDGGVVGGVVGGQVGGVVGGIIGGTGTTEASPAPLPPPPPPPEPKADEGPLRVGGDVKAPVVIHRTEPKYTDTARKAHTTGVVIVEAVIDKNGNVDQVKVLKGLDFGLADEAVAAVKQWKFKPGTLNGQPVDVLFNLTVNFTLQ